MEMEEEHGTLDSAGPWAVWVAIGIVIVVAVGIMLNANVGIEDQPPGTQIATGPTNR
jgi:hypothetical protein